MTETRYVTNEIRRWVVRPLWGGGALFRKRKRNERRNYFGWVTVTVHKPKVKKLSIMTITKSKKARAGSNLRKVRDFKASIGQKFSDVTVHPEMPTVPREKMSQTSTAIQWLSPVPQASKIRKKNPFLRPLTPPVYPIPSLLFSAPKN
jgi:hypothetical protein